MGKRTPAVSSELEFIARHVREADAVWENKVDDIEPEMRRLSNRMYQCADDNVGEILGFLKGAITESAQKHRLQMSDWRGSSGDWEVWRYVHSPNTPEASIGSTGLDIAWIGGLRLVAWIALRGGKYTRRVLVDSCRSEGLDVHLASSRSSLYPDRDWGGCVVWFEKYLTRRSSMNELHDKLRLQGGAFFRITKRLIKSL